MSGGSMEYLYSKVLDASFMENTPERLALRVHLIKLADVLKEVEWVDSCDSSPGRDSELIRALLGPAPVLEQAIVRANTARDELNAAIAAVTHSGS